jgi:manganese/zinc/iron transport system permease protein
MKVMRAIIALSVVALLLGAFTWSLHAQKVTSGHGEREELAGVGSVRSGARFEWPSWEKIWRTATFADHNTRVVFAGVTAFGAVGGLVGTFLLLRKRSLLSDTVSHCTLPGIALAFLIAEAMGISGRSLPLLLTGAVVTGGLGMAAVAGIRAWSRVKDDAALAVVLSVFFGMGVALLVIIQQLPTGNAAGLSHYIYGKAASMTAGDARLILYASLAVALICGLFFKEFKLLCFDAPFAQTQGWPTLALDLLLMGLVVAVTVIGLQAVGLLLVVALLIVPPAAARFWSHQLRTTVLLSTIIGALSGFLGVAASASSPRLPAGAVIVLAAVSCFAVSFIFGARRGLLIRWLEHRRVSARIARQHLLRGIYEWCESEASRGQEDPQRLLDRPVRLPELAAANHWSHHRLAHLVRLGIAQGLLTRIPGANGCHLTAEENLKLGG